MTGKNDLIPRNLNYLKVMLNEWWFHHDERRERIEKNKDLVYKKKLFCILRTYEWRIIKFLIIGEMGIIIRH